MASTLTMARTVSLTDYQPFVRNKADQRTWNWESFYTVGTTNRPQEKYAVYNGLPLAQLRTELSAVPYYDVQEIGEVTLTVVKYLLGTRFSYELIEDNQHIKGLMNDVGEMIGESHGQVVDAYANLPLDRAWATTYQTSYDGKAICATDHPLLDGTTYSNLATAATPGYDTLISMLNTYEWSRKNDAGLIAKDKAKFLVVSKDKYTDWRKIVKNSVEPDTTDRNDTFVKDYGIEIIVDPFLATNTNFFLLGDKAKKDFVFLWRKRMKQDEPWDDKDYRAIKIPSETRFGAVLKGHLGIIGNQGV